MTYFWYAYCIKKLPTSDIYKCDIYFSAMLRKKQSAAEGRKRKREAEKEALMSGKLMASFLKNLS